MKVRLLTGRVGASGTQYAGDVIDVPEREAYTLLERGHAELVEPESAAVAATETAVLDRPRFKGKR